MDKKESLAQEQYMQRLQSGRRQVRLLRAAVLFLFLFSWEISARCGWIDSFIFSSPSRVAETFLTMCRANDLAGHIGITLFETLISFGLVMVCGLAVAVLLWLFPRFFAVAEPYLVVLNSLPKSALAPLLIVWLGANVRTIIVAGMSVAIFGSVISLYSGFSGVDPDMLKLIATLGGNKKDALTKVVLPASVPTILSVFKVNIGLCLVGVVIGEFIGARRGLGYLIIYGSQVFKLDWVIMSILVLCLMAVLLYGMIALLEKRYCQKR